MSKSMKPSSEMFDVNWQKVWPDRIPVIFRDLAPTNPFNPRQLWPEEKDESAVVEQASKKESSKANGGAGKLKKADLIRMQHAKDKAGKQIKLDDEKLANAKKAQNLLFMKMATPTGRLKQLYEILKECLQRKEYTDAVDTLWELQRTSFLPKRSKTGIDGRVKSEKQVKAEAEEDAALREDLRAIHKKYRKHVKVVLKFLDGKDLIAYQLTDMSDRLPPLNMHHMHKLVLDEWQRTVLNHIDNNDSVVVCAPTSSGKTVLSSYVSVVGGKVLFIVPTDPLAWQVAALFQAMVKGSVALITEGTTYLPNEFRVAVGTPKAVESTLLEIGYDFQYAVYDEVHDLNGPEGDALERIIKAVPCPFLALSATIGNASQLREWWQKHHDPSEEKKVHLLEHKARFINLQRNIWHEEDDRKELVALHPCAGLSVDYLTQDGFETGDLAFTPRDTFALWEAMQRHFKKEQIQDVDPHTFFQQKMEEDTQTADATLDFVMDKTEKKKSKKDEKKKDKKKDKDKEKEKDEEVFQVDLGTRTHRITLMESKEYEDVVKAKLQYLAGESPDATKKVLDTFAPPSALTSDASTPTVDVYTLVQQLVKDGLVPAICFQLDSVRCRQLFDQLLASIESAEAAKYPAYKEKLQAEYEEWERSQAQAKKRENKSKSKDKEEEAREAQEFEEKAPPDVHAPHPDFVLASATNRLTASEFKEIKWQLRRELSEEGDDDGHALVRSLRRGIGIYNANLPAAYLRVVQSLAQAGRLAVVLSDESLAYGVNMPFRTCCFLEDTDEGALTSLMVQQMAGRAGRRGLDRQGNIVFAGLTWARMKLLMRGLLPDVKGRQMLYPTISLQRVLSPHVDDGIMQRVVSHPLQAFVSGREEALSDSEYLLSSVKWMTHFGLLEGDAYKLGVDKFVSKLVWECREDPSEALGLLWMLEEVRREFHQKPGDIIANQLQLFNMILRVVGREKYHEEYAHASKLSPLPGQESSWDAMTALLQSYDAHISLMVNDGRASEEIAAQLRLRVPLDEPLDGYVFRTVVDNLIPPGLGTSQLNHIKKRLRHVGDRLRLMHNLLMLSPRHWELEEIFRKCFRRIKWILIDSEV